MKTTFRWIQACLPLSLLLGLSLPTAHAQHVQGEAGAVLLPGDPEQFLENLKNWFGPNDAGEVGSGEKDSGFRQEFGRVTLRADLKIAPTRNRDARGKGNDDLVVNESDNAFDTDASDARNAEDAGGWGLDFIAGGAVDVDLGVQFEALSLEYKKDLWKEDDPNEPESKLTGIRSVLGSKDLTIKIAGFTVRCPEPDTFAGPTEAEKAAFGQDKLLKDGIRRTFFAGFVPILVRGNAGVSINLGVGPVLDLDRKYAGLEFEPAAYLHGWLSAGIGFAAGPFSASAGIAGKLRLIDTTIPLEAGVCWHPDAVRPVYLSAGATIQALKVEIQLYAQMQAGWISRTFTWTVFTFKLGKLVLDFGMNPRNAEFYVRQVCTGESLPPEEPPNGAGTPHNPEPVETSEPRNPQ
jgi:hypothetical protein